MNTIFQWLKQQAFYVGVCGGIIVCLFLSYMRYTGYERMAKTVVDLDNQQKIMEANILLAKGLEKDLENFDNLWLKAETRFLDAAKKAANVSYFYGLDVGSKIYIEEIVQGTPVLLTSLKQMAYWQIPFKMTFEGSFEDVMDYINAVRASPYWMNFQGVRFERILANKREKKKDRLRVILMISCLGGGIHV